MTKRDQRTVYLEDVADDVTVGHVGPMANEYQDSGIPFLRSLNVEPFRINTSDLKYISTEFNDRLRKSELHPGDVVIVRTGKPGACAVIPEWLPVANCSDLVIIRPGPDLDARYLMYYVNSAATGHVAAHLVGAVQQHFNVGSARKMQIPLPPLEEQRAIAHILGTLDDKIELNRQMNRTLDEIARTLFTSWFVNFDPVRAKAEGRQPEGMDAETAALFPDRFVDSELGPIPEGWEVKALGDIANNIRDNVPVDSMSPDDNYVGLEHLPKRQIGLSEWSAALDISSNKSRFVEGDILFGKLRPYFHKVVVAPLSGICSTDILVIRPKHCQYSGLAVCVASSDQIIALANSHSSGTRMPRAKWADLKEFPIALPRSGELLHCFNARLQPVVQMIGHNTYESKTLAELRDTLLPELLSGRVQTPIALEV